MVGGAEAPAASRAAIFMCPHAAFTCGLVLLYVCPLSVAETLCGGRRISYHFMPHAVCRMLSYFYLLLPWQRLYGGMPNLRPLYALCCMAYALRRLMPVAETICGGRRISYRFMPYAVCRMPYAVCRMPYAVGIRFVAVAETTWGGRRSSCRFSLMPSVYAACLMSSIISLAETSWGGRRSSCRFCSAR